MQFAERDWDLTTATVEGSTEEGPALRNAAAILERMAADEAAATVARERYRDGPLPSIDADGRIVGHLFPGESVHGLRTRAILRAAGGEDPSGYGGFLYLTSRRLVHLGKGVLMVKLTDIVESSLAGERLLLTLRNGDGLTLDMDSPRLFRAEMAATMRELRR
jgi:hypothetical protein